MPRVSVIVPSYNAAHFLPESLGSVLLQTESDWEILLVDDGSLDQTRSVVEELSPCFEGRLRYLYQENRGLPAARNKGLGAARGELIALLDADDVWLPRRLELSVKAMESDPSIGLTHGAVERIDAQGKTLGRPWRPPLEDLSGWIAEKIYTRRAHLLCPTVTFRTAALARTGLFDERLRATEDRDLWFRIATYYQVAYVDQILAQYRVSAQSMSQDLNRMFHAQQQFIEKHKGHPACSPRAYRRAQAGIRRERGDALFNRRQLGSALADYAGAVVQDPADRSNAYMLARALCEPLLSPFRRNG